MPLKAKVTVDTPAWLKMIRDKQRPVATAAVAALRETAAEAVQEGRSDIGAAGPGFTHAKWQSGLQYLTKDAVQGGEPSLQASAVIFHRYGIAGVFEHGATISGKPLLWIPTSKDVARLGGARRAKQRGKKLVFATVKGTPLAFDAADKDPHRKPLYVGVPSVTIPKKFHITEIVKEHVANIAVAFVRNFKDN